MPQKRARDMVNLLNAGEYIEHFLSIRTKDGKLSRLRMNEPQKRLYEVIAKRFRAGKPVRVIILKARQMGFSTLTEALIFWATATRANTDSLIVAHTEEATGNLFRMSRLFYDCLPAPLKPARQTRNAQELTFDTRTGAEGAGLRSRIRCATAGGEGVGRSYTLQNVHLSELAYWPGDKLETYTGIMQAVPDKPGTMVIVESTANGYDEFKKLWDQAVQAWRNGDEDGFIPVFFPWYEMAEYRRSAPADFTPSPQERELAQAYHLDNDQLQWRRWCIQVNCGGDLHKFEQEYPASPQEAFLATGASVFDKERLLLRQEAVRDTVWMRGSFAFDYNDEAPRGQKITGIRFTPDPRGLIRIHKEPEAGRPYVIGGDTAGTGSDYFTGQVLDNVTGEQVAVLQHQFDETVYTRQMYCLGAYYNNALLGVETNYSTYPVKELERLGYRKLYVRQREDTFTGEITKAFGVDTNRLTRPLMIDGLKEIARERLELIGDQETLEEMLCFIYDEHYKPQAEAGAHDDLVMALAIAYYIRPQQRFTPGTEEAGRKWSASQWEDYENASTQEREMLLKKWGRPQ